MYPTGAVCKPWEVTTPVCVLGMGLIGGSLMRAGQAAGREVFGYNRSIDAVRAATADGFDVTEDLTAALKRAASTEALAERQQMVLSLPFPAYRED